MGIDGPHGFDAFLRQIPFRWIGGVHHQMHMGMMGLIVKCRIPFQVPAVNLIILTQKLHPASQ